MARQRKKSKAKKKGKKASDIPAQEGGKENTPGAFSHIEAADAACLVGELHLQKGDYLKAIEAFTRAIESHPTPDAYQGRAQAYRALADSDERRAQEQSA